MSFAIRATGLSKVYGGSVFRLGRSIRALDEVDIRVPPGLVFGLVGLNGAGKTTFIKAVLGVVRPTSGDVKVLGGSPEEISVRRRIGYLPERLYLPGAWTPPAFLASIARIKGLKRPKEEIDRQLSRVDLLADAGRRVGGFSKGMRQRLGLAAALLGSPELLVLDEPTDGIDPLGRVTVRNILMEERRRGATVFLNSHMLSEIEKISDHLAVLHRGRLMCQGSVESLCDSLEGWRVRFLDPPPAQLAKTVGFALDEKGPWWRFEGTDAGTFNSGLAALHEAGANVVEVVPVGRDLESLLARVVDSVRGGKQERPANVEPGIEGRDHDLESSGASVQDGEEAA